MISNSSGTIVFTGLIVGEFKTSCDMDFNKFPFDQYLFFSFILKISLKIVLIDKVAMLNYRLLKSL